MTATQSFTNHDLRVNLDDDTMEMATSPYPTTHDNDIDFDLDDDPRENSLQDNNMIDDHTVNMPTDTEEKDVMFDEDDNDLVDYDQDFSMDAAAEQDVNLQHDAPDDQSIQDVNYEDAEDEDLTLMENDEKDESIEEPIDPTLQEEATNTEFHTTEDLEIQDTREESGPGDDTLNNQDNVLIEPAAPDSNFDVTQESDVKDFAPENLLEATSTRSERPEDGQEYSHTEHPVELAEHTQPSTDETRDIENLAAELENPVDRDHQSGTLENDETISRSPQRESSPSNLHPVTVRYNGEDCWLFPPLDNTETRHVFLQDTSLASEPFDRLIAALRSGLVNDQEMADHDELVFDIPVLGLHICEDSKHASLMSLSRVIDIYMMLSQNEGLTVFEPLLCELNTRVCLADQFAYVEDAAFVRRITYTDFVGEQADSPEEVIDESHAEILEIEHSTVHEDEQPHADTSIYHDAADGNGEEEVSSILDEVNQANVQDNEAAQNSQTELAESPEIEDHEIQQGEALIDAIVEPDTAPVVASPLVKPSVGDIVPSNEVGTAQSSPEREQIAQGALPLPGQQGESISEGFDEVPTELEGSIEIEAEEDLFADDDVEDETEEAVIAQARIDANEAQPEKAVANDEFDFDDWSDDEQDNKTENASEVHATPTNGINGKRKLLEDEDDILDIDVSTPEPKRSRQS